MNPAMQKVLRDGLRCVAGKEPTLGSTPSPSLIETSTERQPTWLQYGG